MEVAIRTSYRRMMRRPRRSTQCLLSLALFLPGFAGCGLPALLAGHFETPVATLASSKVQSISPMASEIAFVLTLHNPNSYGLRTQVVRYRLSVNGAVVAEGSKPAEVALPADESTPVRFTVDVGFDALEKAAAGALVIGEVPYQLETWISLRSWLQPREVYCVAASVLRFNVPLELAMEASISR